MVERTGEDLLRHYRDLLESLASSGTHSVSEIYKGAATGIVDYRHVEALVKGLNSIDWFSAKKDGLGDLYEGILAKNASEAKAGAGQYFTPRPLIDSIIRVVQPSSGEVIVDPAAGTGGFLIAADAYIKQNTSDLEDLGSRERDFQERRAYWGIELVPSTRRLALMNCHLHGIQGAKGGAIRLGSALSDVGTSVPKADLILSNPPFGTAKGGGTSARSDLLHKTNNKQLLFIQHIYQSLKPGGRAAVVVPDNVLFESGVGAEVRRGLMDVCRLHTILRLPTGIFYAQGVNTNVLFFQKGSIKDPNQKAGCSEDVWIYDLRTNMPSFGRKTPFSTAELAAFELAYGPDKNGVSCTSNGVRSELARFKRFSRDEISARGDSLDFIWLREERSTKVNEEGSPDKLINEIIAELAEALKEAESVLDHLSADL
jgi:type I restriction enzyme M protein